MNNVMDTFQRLVFQNNVLSSFLFMLNILFVRWVYISFYFSLIYFGICFFKKATFLKLNAQTNYYCWFLLILSPPLASLKVNDNLTALLLNALFTGKSYSDFLYIIFLLLTILWFSVVVYKIISCLFNFIKIQKLLRKFSSFYDREGLVAKAKLTLAINKRINVQIADFIDSPVSYGIFKQYILIPDNYTEKYTNDELYLIFLHELTHIKNGDTVKNWIINLIEGFMWFNPVMLRFCKHFRQDTEILCDNQVLGLQNNARETYGRLLIKGCSNHKTVFGFGFSDYYYMLKNRIDAMYNYKPIKYNCTSIASLAAILFMLVSAVVQCAFTNHINVNRDYNSTFEIIICNSDYTLSKIIDANLYNNVLEIRNNTIYINKSALKELLCEFSTYGYETAIISSKNFTYATNQFSLTEGNKYRFNLNEILSDTEERPHYTYQLYKRSPLEYLLLLIASKI